MLLIGAAGRVGCLSAEAARQTSTLALDGSGLFSSASSPIKAPPKALG
jgi:hypothetical protein